MKDYTVINSFQYGRVLLYFPTKNGYMASRGRSQDGKMLHHYGRLQVMYSSRSGERCYLLMIHGISSTSSDRFWVGTYQGDESAIYYG